MRNDGVVVEWKFAKDRELFLAHVERFARPAPDRAAIADQNGVVIHRPVIQYPMKLHLSLMAGALTVLCACDTRVNVPPADHDTTIVNPPAEKKEEKKTETTTTVGPGTTEKKTETTETKP